MKKVICLSCNWIVFSLLQTFNLNAQTYPDYILYGITPQTQTSIIRDYSPDQWIIYHVDAATSLGVISLTDISGNRNYIELDYGYEVYDMQSWGDDLFICGQYAPTGSAFLASIPIPDIASGGSANVRYQVSNNASVLYKMVVYPDDNHNLRVVALGDEYYANNNYPSILVNNNYKSGGISYTTLFDPCASSSCTQNLLFEFVNPQNYWNTTAYDFIPVNDRSADERIDDIVVTDNFVALISRVSSFSTPILAIRLCDKNDVVNTYPFNINWCYIPDEGHSKYVCCSMMGDTIALATRGEYILGSGVPYDIRIRTIDLYSMTMTGSQAFSLNNYMSDPIDMVYVPDKHTLVLLQDMIFPTNGSVNNYTFLFVEPYNTFSPVGTVIVGPTPPNPAPYMAKGIYEQVYGLSFSSIDWIEPLDCFLASGGDYWILKNLTTQPPSPPCYITDYVDIHKIADLSMNTYSINKGAGTESFLITDIPTPVLSSNYNLLCK